MELAPIIIFGFDRPRHLENLINSLVKNAETKNSDAYIYIDGPTDKINFENYENVKKLVSQQLPFRNTYLTIRETNFECKWNIIKGVTEVIDKFNKVIVLEDDLIVGKYFLNYMNSALNLYKNDEKIWHINGYCHPQLIKSKNSAAFGTLAQPWGWGTWKSKWDVFIDEKHEYTNKNIISTLTDEERKKFNFYNLASYWEDALKFDQIKKNSIWDAYWYQTIFLNKGLTLFPQISHIQNEGFDGSGLHCGINNDFHTALNSHKTYKFPLKIKESKLYKYNTLLFFKKYQISRYFRFHKPKFESFESFYRWILKKVKNLLLNK